MKEKIAQEEFFSKAKMTISPDYVDKIGPALFPDRLKAAEASIARYCLNSKTREQLINFIDQGKKSQSIS